MQIISFLISCLFLCSNGDFFTILDLPEGEHQYKFYVDGQWVHDPNEVIEVSLLIQRSSSNECFALYQKIVCFRCTNVFNGCDFCYGYPIAYTMSYSDLQLKEIKKIEIYVDIENKQNSNFNYKRVLRSLWRDPLLNLTKHSFLLGPRTFQHLVI